MKMYLISDNIDTLTGMRLAGVEGAIARSREELSELLDRAFKDKDIGIVLLNEKFSVKYPDITNAAKMNKNTLVIEIPDRHGTGRRPDFITSYINEAIGVKL